MKVYFSILKYHLITDESINLAILFYNEKTDERRLEIITNWQRIKSFDDELDMKFLKMLLQGIQEEIKSSFFSNSNDFDIHKYTKSYVNELQFSEIFENLTDDFENLIKETKMMILRYDYDKKVRPKINEQIKFIKNLMKSNNLKFTTNSIVGKHFENVQYDYIIDNNAFKLFTFQDKNLNNLVSTAKSWAFTASEMERKYNTIFIYDTEVKDAQFKSIINILASCSYKVLNIEQAVEFILYLKSSNGIYEQSKF
jgi:hypothetical protein